VIICPFCGLPVIDSTYHRCRGIGSVRDWPISAMPDLNQKQVDRFKLFMQAHLNKCETCQSYISRGEKDRCPAFASMSETLQKWQEKIGDRT